MRLLNVKSLELQEFFGAYIPQYVILSHRWEDEEVTFQDFKSGKGKNMIGWSKIEGCCNLAIKDSIEYAWIDSCCIDKNSSAELSEAINSMFRWYRDAETCYAFLSDVAGPLNVGQNIDSFRFSKWFTRGWTLQELLAPDDLVFFDKSWENIGTKSGHKDLISEITGIKRRHLFEFEGASTAQRMSWTSKRETTRIEDQAYCLLGIFGVNMPPLYGEGSGAFLRLQLEILKISTDESLFAWEDDALKSGGLLAPSPTSFKYASDVKCLKPPLILRPPYSMTHKGLEIVFELMETEPPHGYNGPPRRWMVAPLNCRREDNRPTVLTLVLSYKEFAQTSTNTEREEYERLECSTLPTREKKSVRQHILVGSEFKAIHVKQPRLYPESGSYCHFRIITQSMCLAGWKVTTRLVLDPERGRWRTDCHNTLYLKLLNSYAIIRLELSREAYEYGDFFLLLSCQGKQARAELITRTMPHWCSPIEGSAATDMAVNLMKDRRCGGIRNSNFEKHSENFPAAEGLLSNFKLIGHVPFYYLSSHPSKHQRDRQTDPILHPILASLSTRDILDSRVEFIVELS